MANIQFPFPIKRSGSSSPATYANDVDISAIEGLNATDVQTALAQIYDKAKTGGLSDEQIATAIEEYLSTHPIEGVAEAPKDGKKYARKDGLWSEISESNYAFAFLEETAMDALTSDNTVGMTIYFGLEEDESSAQTTYDTTNGKLSISNANYDNTNGKLTLPNATFNSSTGQLKLN